MKPLAVHSIRRLCLFFTGVGIVAGLSCWLGVFFAKKHTESHYQLYAQFLGDVHKASLGKMFLRQDGKNDAKEIARIENYLLAASDITLDIKMLVLTMESLDDQSLNTVEDFRKVIGVMLEEEKTLRDEFKRSSVSGSRSGKSWFLRS